MCVCVVSISFLLLFYGFSVLSLWGVYFLLKVFSFLSRLSFPKLLLSVDLFRYLFHARGLPCMFNTLGCLLILEWGWTSWRCAWACRLCTSKGALIEYRVIWLGLLFGGTSDVSMSWAVESPQKRLFQSFSWTVRERLVASDLWSRWKVAGSLIICMFI